MQRYVAILQQNPGNVDALYYVAVIAHPAGAVRRGPQGDRARARARARRRRGCTTSRARRICGRTQDDDALHSFSRAIEVDPAFADAYGNRGTLLVRDGPARRRRWPTSTARWRCGRTMPEDHCNRASALADLGRLDEALQGFNRAIALMPADGAGLFQPRRCADAARAAGRGAARLRPGDRALSGDAGGAQPARDRVEGARPARRGAGERRTRARAATPTSPRRMPAAAMC